MKRPSLHRVQSVAVLRAADTTHDAASLAPAQEVARNGSQPPARTPRKSKSSPRLDQLDATAEAPGAPSLPPSKSTHRASGFTSKFRFFRSRRADSVSDVIDGLPPVSASTLAKLAATPAVVPLLISPSGEIDPLGLHIPSGTASKLRKSDNPPKPTQHQTRVHRAYTAPPTTVAGVSDEEKLTGLGITDLYLDVRTGKYRFHSSGLSPSACDMERSHSSTGTSSTGESGGPGTPTESIPPIPDSGEVGKTFERTSVDEPDYEEIIGLLRSMFPARVEDVAEVPRQSLDSSVAEGSSPSLQAADSSCSIRAIRPRRSTNSSVPRNTPDIEQSLPTRSSSLRGSESNSRITATSTN